MIMFPVILWCLDVVLILPNVPLSLQKGDESKSIDGLHRQHGEHESKGMRSVSTGVKLLVDYSSNTKGRDSAKSCLGKEESNGSKGSKESAGTFDHVLDGAVGAVVLSEGTIFLVGNEWGFDLLLTVGSDGLVEEGVGSHISLEAILVSHGGKVDEHDGLSKDNEAEVEPLEVQGLDGINLLVEDCRRSTAGVGNTQAEGRHHGHHHTDLLVVGSVIGSSSFGLLERNSFTHVEILAIVFGSEAFAFAWLLIL